MASQDHVAKLEQADVTQEENLNLQTDHREHAVDSLSADDDEAFSWTFDIFSNVISLALFIFAGSWAQLVPTSAIAFIAIRFPEEADNANLIAIVSSIVPAVVTSLVGELSDIFGRRPFLLFGCAMSIVGLLLGGLATSLRMVIIGQVFNGLGIGCSFLATPLLQEIVPNKQRPEVTALAAGIASISFIAAPIIEGVFIAKGYGGPLDGFRIGFYVGAALYAIVGLGLVVFYRPAPRPNPEDLTVFQKLRKLDLIGVVLIAAGITLFLLGINFGDNPYSWGSGIVLGPMITGITLIVAFAIWEWKGTDHGLLPHELFADKNFTITVIIRFVGGIALYGGQTFLPQVAVYVFGTNGLQTAVWQLPFSVSSVVGAFMAAGILRWLKEVRIPIIISLCFMTLGGGLCILIKPDVSFVTWFFSCALMGLALGSESVMLTLVAGLVVPSHHIATAVCVALASGFLGGAVATSMYGIIYRSTITKTLAPAIAKAALGAGLPASSVPELVHATLMGDQEALASVPGASAVIFDAVQRSMRFAYANAFSYIWYTLIGWCVLCIIVSAFYGPISQYMTDEVAAPVQARSPSAKAKKDKVWDD